MSTFLVGMTMSSPNHDYTPAHIALGHIKAKKVSERIYLCEVDDEKGPLIFALIQQCLALQDKLIARPAPKEFLTALAA